VDTAISIPEVAYKPHLGKSKHGRECENVHTTVSYAGTGNNIQIGTNDNTKMGIRTEATHEHQAAT
jgi:hypothetical protein